MSQNDFSFWNESSIEGTPEKAVEKRPEPAVSPVFPDKLTVSWIRDQLPEAVWAKATKGNGLCSPEMIKVMADFARKTPSKRAISVRAGTSPHTWNEWEARAARGEQPYLLWYQCIAVSLSELEEELIDNIRGASMSDWKAATWLLGRVNKDEFGDVKPTAPAQASTTVEVKADKSTKVTINSLTREDTDRIADIMSQIGAFNPPAELEEGEIVDGDVVEEG